MDFQRNDGVEFLYWKEIKEIERQPFRDKGEK